jgi:hypothetical protein
MGQILDLPREGVIERFVGCYLHLRFVGTTVKKGLLGYVVRGRYFMKFVRKAIVAWDK